MSDLAATNCGCGCEDRNGCSSIIWILLLLCCCGNGGGFSAPSKMELGLKVSPREMAHAITPYIIKELQAQGQWEDVR